MCFTAKPALLCAGSASSVRGAAATRAARRSVILGYLLERSGDLPELQHRAGVPTRGAKSLDHPLGERTSVGYDVQERIEVPRFVQSRRLLPALQPRLGDAEKVAREIEGGHSPWTSGAERGPGDVALELQQVGELP